MGIPFSWAARVRDFQMPIDSRKQRANGRLIGSRNTEDHGMFQTEPRADTGQADCPVRGARPPIAAEDAWVSRLGGQWICMMISASLERFRAR